MSVHLSNRARHCALQCDQQHSNIKNYNMLHDDDDDNDNENSARLIALGQIETSLSVSAYSHS